MLNGISDGAGIFAFGSSLSVPGEVDVRSGNAGVIGKICVIGSHLKEEAIAKLFGVN